MIKITPRKSINGLFSVPGDKSISHRAIMLAALCDGETEINGLLTGEDCLSTIACLKALGTEIELDEATGKAVVRGKGLYGFTAPEKPLDAGNSGTTMRLLSGILAAQPFTTIITGDESLQKRPMARIIEPLTRMGAEIKAINSRAPLTIKGNPNLSPINHISETASAQVKSCVLLAGLYANGETTVKEPVKSRNHTEIMLKYLGAGIKNQGTSVTLTGGRLVPRPIRVCGDISSAAYLIAAALILENSEITITNVGVNLTRTGIISVLREMGGEIDVLNKRVMCGENVADIRVRSSELHGTEISGAIIPSLIDEIPIIAAAALFAKGRTIIRDAAELKIKESNRIDALAVELTKMNGKITPTEDGLIIEGGNALTGAQVNSRNDHRIAMSIAVAALKASGETNIENGNCAGISFPGFYDEINRCE